MLAEVASEEFFWIELQHLRGLKNDMRSPSPPRSLPLRHDCEIPEVRQSHELVLP